MPTPTTRLISKAALTASLLLPSAAHAATVKVCAKYQVQYDDSDLLDYDDEIHGDWFNTNSNKKARGAKTTLKNIGTGSTVSQYADWEGADAGCASFSGIPSGTAYDIKIKANALIRGNTVKVWDDVATPNMWVSTMESNWSHSAGSGATVLVNTETANAHEAWNVAAAAGFALYARDVGLTNKTFDLHTDNGSICSGSCERDGDVYLSSTGENAHFIIAHELGHAVEHFVSNNQGTHSYNTPFEGVCVTDSTRSHEMASKEWQSAAIREGWAHFYAAASFNSTADTACGFVYYKSIDYDLDPASTIDGGSTHGMSCEVGPDNLFGSPTPPVIPHLDYLGEFCDLSLDGHSTELDWLRFWWNLLQEESTVSFDECADVLGVAIEGTFQTPTAPTPWTDDATSSDPAFMRPSVRMRQAAIALGLGTEWDDHYFDHGVDR